jgi:hypothetical protein
MSGNNTPAWIAWISDVKESKGSKVNDSMSSAELTSVATVLGCDISEMITKKKIAAKINQHLEDLEEKSDEKYLAKLVEGLATTAATADGSISDSAVAEAEPPLKEELQLQLDTPNRGSEIDAQARKRSPLEPAEGGEPKRLKTGDDEEDEEVGRMESGGKRKVASSSERLYELKISPDSEIYQLEVASPLFATARVDLVAKWGTIAGEVFGKSVFSALGSCVVMCILVCLFALSYHEFTLHITYIQMRCSGKTSSGPRT